MSVTVVLFFFNDTATTEIYTLSLHDALPIYRARAVARRRHDGRRLRAVRHRDDDPAAADQAAVRRGDADHADRKSTRLNSSHANISYAVFCLKKKKNIVHVLTPVTTLSRLPS